MGDLSGSREPNPQAVSALTGFDPGRIVREIMRLRPEDATWAVLDLLPRLEVMKARLEAMKAPPKAIEEEE